MVVIAIGNFKIPLSSQGEKKVVGASVVSAALLFSCDCLPLEAGRRHEPRNEKSKNGGAVVFFSFGFLLVFFWFSFVFSGFSSVFFGVSSGFLIVLN